MPPRRSSTHSPSKKPKVKHDDGNRSLDAFFIRSPQRPGAAEATKHRATASSSKLMSEADEYVALDLSAKAGLNSETTMILEQKWKPARPSSSQNHAFLQVIDVDALDDNVSLHGESFEVRLRRKLSKRIEFENVSLGESAEATVRDGERHSPSLRFSEVNFPGKHELSAKGVSTAVNIASFPNLAEDPLLSSVTLCPWKSNPSTSMAPILTPYSFLTHALCALSGTRSRIAILNILTNCLRFIIYHDPSALLPALYLLSNSLAPPYVPIELGLGPSAISRAIQHVSGLSPASLKQLYTKSGDAGDAAFEAKSTQRTLVPHPPLTLVGVFKSLLQICNAKGDGATKRRQTIMEKLLVSANGEEVRYLVRTMAQHIRVGAVRTSILTALARAFVLTRPATCQNVPTDESPYFVSPQTLSLVNGMITKGKKKDEEDPIRGEIMIKFGDAEKLLKRVYVQHPNFDHIAIALSEGGLEQLADRVLLTVGIPLHPTLGSPTRSLDEVYERLGNLQFAAEFKYDGQRAQIHARKEDGDLLVRIFSRHLEEMTDKYPDVVALIREMLKTSSQLRSFIIDAEIVAVDALDGSIGTFQELSNRARKDVRLEDVKVRVCVFAFDLMFLNEESLLEQPFRVRRHKLKAYFPPIVPNFSNPFISKFDHVESCESEKGREAVEDFWQRAVESRSEGLMVKLLDSGEVFDDPNGSKTKQRKKPLPATYEPDKRTSAWLKLKKDYVLGLGDSLDLVPIGAWHGNGRKAAWWSPILLAAWDERAGQLVGVCKCMSGFTDEFYKSLQERYPEASESCSRTSLWNVNSGGYCPEVHFRPQEVWEIRGADITLSPVSVAALGTISQDRGLSLRFPRFMRLREDKGITDASTPDFLATMWRKQESKGKNTAGVDDGDLVDISPEASAEEDEEEQEGN